MLHAYQALAHYDLSHVFPALQLTRPDAGRQPARLRCCSQAGAAALEVVVGHGPRSVVLLVTAAAVVVVVVAVVVVAVAVAAAHQQ